MEYRRRQARKEKKRYIHPLLTEDDDVDDDDVLHVTCSVGIWRGNFNWRRYIICLLLSRLIIKSKVLCTMDKIYEEFNTFLIEDNERDASSFVCFQNNNKKQFQFSSTMDSIFWKSIKIIENENQATKGSFLKISVNK